MSRAPLAPLTSTEEVTLRRVAHAMGGERLPKAHLHRLERLKLIEWHRDAWRLTPLGDQRYDSLPKPPLGRGVSMSLEVERILDKYHHAFWRGSST